jgi:hypothetical protein
LFIIYDSGSGCAGCERTVTLKLDLCVFSLFSSRFAGRWVTEVNEDGRDANLIAGFNIHRPHNFACKGLSTKTCGLCRACMPTHQTGGHDMTQSIVGRSWAGERPALFYFLPRYMSLLSWASVCFSFSFCLHVSWRASARRCSILTRDLSLHACFRGRELVGRPLLTKTGCLGS